jgi:hypothetical protein
MGTGSGQRIRLGKVIETALPVRIRDRRRDLSQKRKEGIVVI